MHLSQDLLAIRSVVDGGSGQQPRYCKYWNCGRRNTSSTRRARAASLRFQVVSGSSKPGGGPYRRAKLGRDILGNGALSPVVFRL